MRLLPRLLKDMFDSINEELLKPLIACVEGTSAPAQELMGSLREFLKDIFRVDVNKKNLPPYVDTLISKNYNFHKLLPKSIGEGIKSDTEFFFLIYDVLIDLSPLILTLALVFFLKFIKLLIFLLIFVFIRLFNINYCWCIYNLTQNELILVFFIYAFFFIYGCNILKTIASGVLYEKGILAGFYNKNYDSKPDDQKALLLAIDLIFNMLTIGVI